ncbi:hypothetical protein [Variovorax sp. ZT4R33]|uniref:hypothetical protein n=1 Tax=Variovorax sp. ZT4R33 TaxID=3443743 RepID=UPI003F45AE87
MPTPDKLNEAFEAWHRAIDEHVDMMRAVTTGQPLDVQAMTQKVGEIDTLHATWMEMVMRRDEEPA